MLFLAGVSVSQQMRTIIKKDVNVRILTFRLVSLKGKFRELSILATSILPFILSNKNKIRKIQFLINWPI
jgi:hypothetical protein